MKADLENKIQECAQQQQKLIDAQQETNRLLEEKKSVEEKLSDEHSRAISAAQQSADSTVRERELREKLGISEKSFKELEERLRSHETTSKDTLEKALMEAEESKAQLEHRISVLEAVAALSDAKIEMSEHKRNVPLPEYARVRTRMLRDEALLEEAARYKKETERYFDELNSGPEILILNITWGNQQFLWDPKVHDQVYRYAKNNWEFTWDDNFFCGNNPKQDGSKDGFIAYCKRGSAPVILQGDERTTGRFV